MTQVLAQDIRLDQGRRSPGGILSAAFPLPDGWENGVAFRTIGCGEPTIINVCEVTDTTEVRPDMASFEPIFIRQSAACAIMSKIGSVDMASDRLEATTEWGLGNLLATGGGTANPSLADATSVHVSDDDNPALGAANAVSCLEQAAANLGFGAEVVLHAPARAAAYLTAMNLNINGFSPMGHQWILNPGYPVDDDTVTIWATGTVWASVTEGDVLVGKNGGSGWRTNLDAAYKQRLGLAVFDPCLNLAASFAVPTCNGGS